MGRELCSQPKFWEQSKLDLPGNGVHLCACEGRQMPAASFHSCWKPALSCSLCPFHLSTHQQVNDDAGSGQLAVWTQQHCSLLVGSSSFGPRKTKVCVWDTKQAAAIRNSAQHRYGWKTLPNTAPLRLRAQVPNVGCEPKATGSIAWTEEPRLTSSLDLLIQCVHDGNLIVHWFVFTRK